MTLVVAHDLAVGYGGPAVLEGLTFGVEPGQRVGVLGPNGGGKSTLVRALLGELAPLAGRLELAVRCSVVPQTERSRLDYPVSALDVALMGSLSAPALVAAPGPPRAHAARSRRLRPSTSPIWPAGPSASSRAVSASASWWPARSCRTPASCCSTSRSRASTPPAPRCSPRSSTELAAEGRGVLVATHDVDQARGFDRVLCLNGRQIAFGAARRAHALRARGDLRRRDRLGARGRRRTTRARHPPGAPPRARSRP